jgi:LysM repeat protein
MTAQTFPHHLRRGLIVGLLLVLLAGYLPPTHAQSPADQIIVLVNGLRASLGLPAFTPNSALTAAAQSHAQWMAANQSYTHTGAGGSRPQDRATTAGYQGYVSENIVGGTNLSPQQGVVWWENSAIHYQTMTSTRHIHIGAGYASGSGQNMYVIVVGVPSDYAPAPGSQTTSGGSAPVQADAPIVAVPVVPAEPAEDGSVIHEIQIGQTAWDLAAVYDVPLDDILRYNNLPDDPILLPGDQIVIVPGENMPALNSAPLTHTVQSGQTVWAIAARYNLSVGDLLALNGLAENSLIQPGDELIIRLAPGQSPPPTATPPLTHIVASGQTAWAIALQYGLALEELLALNDLTEDSLLLPGDELFIRAPDATSTAPPPTSDAYTAVAVQQGSTPTASPTDPGDIHLTMTAMVEPTSTFTPTPPPTIGPTVVLPTLVPDTPPPADGGDRSLVGAIVIALGVLALGGMGIIELVDRLRR